ncbi:MAG: 7-carboxy-7-deazaguanine synthase QueE [Sedimentisphaerales bacterium]|nr:7-carboxy-7-deazaguanine synthase QueE [Sedimentisphaerales bacterium]
MVVNEIFYSLQGEGGLAGVPSVFIRLAGCPLKCKWCDTSYAFSYDAGEDLSVEQIIEKVKAFNCNHFVVTGGEPLVDSDLTERAGLRDLLDELKRQGGHITIETSGVVFVGGLACDLMSISPKLENAGLKTPVDLDTLQQLIIEYDCQFKFVVESEKDISEIQRIVGSLAGIDRDRVFLMPQAKSRNEYLERAPQVSKWCLEYGFTFSPRLQVVLWDNEPGK